MLCSNVHPIWGKITSLTHLVFRWVETTQGGLFSLGPCWTPRHWELTYVPIDHGGVMVVLLGLETTCEPAIADGKKLGGFSMFSFG